MDDFRTNASAMGFDTWAFTGGFDGGGESIPETRPRFFKLYGSSIVLSGALVVPGAIENEQERKILAGLLKKLERAALISSATLDAALEFVAALGSAPLPKVAAESGGGLLMTWTTSNGERTLVTLEDSTLYAVLHSGTEAAEYIDDETFTGDVPRAILQAISA